MIAIVVGIKSKDIRCSIETDASPRVVASECQGEGAPAGQADTVQSNDLVS